MTSTSPQDGSEITLQIILEHMQAMKQDLLAKMDHVAQKIDIVDIRLTKRIDALDRRMGNLSYQIEAIDQRLDVVEIESLPKRVRKLEEVVFRK